MRSTRKYRRKSSSPPSLPFPQYRVWNTIAGFDTFLRAPDFGHDVRPAGLPGGGQWFNPPDSPAIAGDKQRLALLKLVQDHFGFLVQLFCGDYAHVLKVTPQKCPRKRKSFAICELRGLRGEAPRNAVLGRMAPCQSCRITGSVVIGNRFAFMGQPWSGPAFHAAASGAGPFLRCGPPRG